MAGAGSQYIPIGLSTGWVVRINPYLTVAAVAIISIVVVPLVNSLAVGCILFIPIGLSSPSHVVVIRASSAVVISILVPLIAVGCIIVPPTGGAGCFRVIFIISSSMVVSIIIPLVAVGYIIVPPIGGTGCVREIFVARVSSRVTSVAELVAVAIRYIISVSIVSLWFVFFIGVFVASVI